MDKSLSMYNISMNKIVPFIYNNDCTLHVLAMKDNSSMTVSSREIDHNLYNYCFVQKPLTHCIMKQKELIKNAQARGLHRYVQWL